MKKVKKLLVTAIAALSLSSCSLEDIKNLPAQVGDTISSTFNDLLEKVGLKKKENKEEEAGKQEEPGKEDEKEPGEGEKPQEPCNHVDANHDGKCDLCGESGLEVNHSDENHDHLCDVCGAEVSQHADNDHDHNCDECGAVISQHLDENPADHLCDICGEKISDCKDDDNDFKCDVCGKDLEAVDFSLDTSEAIINFSLGEEFTSSGLKVIATSEVGSTMEIEEFEASEPDMSEVGDKEVTVTFSFGEEEHELSYTINVSYWSEFDLYMFEEFSFTGYSPLPYLPGSSMRVEYELDEEGYLDSWWIQVDEISSAQLTEYRYLLRNWVGTFEDSYGDTVTLELEEANLTGLEDVYGLTNMVGYRLIPAYTYGGDDYREFPYDEIFVSGKDSEGNFIMFSRMIETYFEYELNNEFGTEPFDGGIYYGQYMSYILNYVKKASRSFISELTSDALLFPQSNAELFYISSLKSEYPYDPSLDDFSIGVETVLSGGTESEFNAFIDALELAGYELEESDGIKSYVLENEYVGAITYEITEYSETCIDEFFYWIPDAAATLEIENAGFGFTLYIESPASYTTRLSAEIDALLEALEVEDFEIDNESYPQSGVSSVFYSRSIEEGQTASAIMSAELGKLIALGFEVTEEVEAVADGVYHLALSNFTTLNVEVYIIEDEEEVSFICGVSRFYSFTAEDVYAAIFGSVPYEINESGNAEAVVAELESDTPDMSALLSLTFDAKDAVGEIANVDNDGVYGDSSTNPTYYFFSGVTKDGKLIFSVYALPSDEGYVFEVQVEVLSAFEKFAREMAEYFNGVAIREVTYEADGESFVVYENAYGYAASASNFKGLANDFADQLFNGDDETDPAFPGFTFLSETEATEESYELTYTNGEYDFTISMYPYMYGSTAYCGVSFSVSIHAE